MEPLLLRLDTVSCAHPRRGSVHKVSLELKSREIVGVSGRPGAGKSILLRGAIGLDRLHEGRVQLFGQDVGSADYDQLDALRRRAAFASLSASLLANLSIRENMVIPLIMRGSTRPDAESRSDALLDRLGLSDYASLRPHQYVLSILCLANVARALVQDAELYLLDEPSRGLDEQRFILLREEVLRLRERGAGFLISLDDDARWRDVLDRVIDLDQLNGTDQNHAYEAGEPQ